MFKHFHRTVLFCEASERCVVVKNIHSKRNTLTEGSNDIYLSLCELICPLYNRVIFNPMKEVET